MSQNGAQSGQPNPEAVTPETADKSAPASKMTEMQTEIDELKSQLEKSKNEYLYLRAEFDTYRRNVIKERADLTKYGSERLVSELLGVLDNFERALETRLSSENYANYAKGVEMTAQELRSVLQKFGVNEVPSLGQPFDPAVHEALTSEVTTAAAPGSVLRVLRKPYKLHDRIVRPGQVIVAKGPEGKGE